MKYKTIAKRHEKTHKNCISKNKNLLKTYLDQLMKGIFNMNQQYKSVILHRTHKNQAPVGPNKYYKTTLEFHDKAIRQIIHTYIHGWGIKNMYHPCRTAEFCSQHPHWTTHNCLYITYSRFPKLLSGLWEHLLSHVYTHIYKLLNNKIHWK